MVAGVCERTKLKTIELYTLNGALYDMWMKSQ